jgi:hypothetical protein
LIVGPVASPGGGVAPSAATAAPAPPGWPGEPLTGSSGSIGESSRAPMRTALWAVPAVAAVSVVAVVGLSLLPLERIGAPPPQQSPEVKQQKEMARSLVVTPEPTVADPSENAPDGWVLIRPGIFRRWCMNDPECAGAEEKDFTGNGYTALLVWCRDRPCGDIYARVNLLDGSGVVVGWTNDTGYGGMGQKVLLVFRMSEGSSKSQLTELKMY